MSTPPPRKRKADTKPGTSGPGEGVAEDAFPKSEIPAEPKLAAVPGRRGTNLKQPLMAMYGTIGFGVGMVRPQIGQAIMESAEACATEWDNLARQNPAVKRALEAMTKVSATGSLIMAHTPIILALVSEFRPDVVERFATAQMPDAA